MKYILLFFSIATLISCNSNQLAKDFNCETSGFSNLESVEDIKKKFRVELPKHWKTKLYYDDGVSSIYSADTTISLSKTIVMDVSFINNTSEIDYNFIAKVKSDNTQQELTELHSKKVKFLRNSGYYNLAKGKRGKYDYHLLNVFSKTKTGFIHAKTEIYGDSLVDERLCKSILLLHKIDVN
ncbi:hypothetical protein [Tenacibaculum agarivorans]|uniref:hypothetical protein n=1 Tax=Tenacibaculum agarivorans TaxID=1908389 RepID=UPI00094BB9A3|nr:hypothetical protein [Tenacibaculum agarivorans]